MAVSTIADSVQRVSISSPSRPADGSNRVPVRNSSADHNVSGARADLSDRYVEGELLTRASGDRGADAGLTTPSVNLNALLRSQTPPAMHSIFALSDAETPQKSALVAFEAGGQVFSIRRTVLEKHDCFLSVLASEEFADRPDQNGVFVLQDTTADQLRATLHYFQTGRIMQVEGEDEWASLEAAANMLGTPEMIASVASLRRSKTMSFICSAEYLDFITADYSSDWKNSFRMWQLQIMRQVVADKTLEEYSFPLVLAHQSSESQWSVQYSTNVVADKFVRLSLEKLRDIHRAIDLPGGMLALRGLDPLLSLFTKFEITLLKGDCRFQKCDFVFGPGNGYMPMFKLRSVEMTIDSRAS